MSENSARVVALELRNGAFAIVVNNPEGYKIEKAGDTFGMPGLHILERGDFPLDLRLLGEQYKDFYYVLRVDEFLNRIMFIHVPNDKRSSSTPSYV